MRGRPASGQYACRRCGTTFDEPVERERRGHNSPGRGLAGKLDRMDPDDVGQPMTDGSGHECDACGETFRTLTKLRLHEKDDCPMRATFGAIDTDAEDAGEQAAAGLLQCRQCGQVNPNADFDHSTSFDGDDFHLIVGFQCRQCAFENENRVVLEDVDPDSLGDLPEHLQPDEEIATDGGLDVGLQIASRLRDLADEVEVHGLEGGDIVVDGDEATIVETVALETGGDR
ncbi:hypothetical protein NDI56_03845 [Haloarcula sp. S1CR25-12]|uniref:C2H2-type domain-containing protein n=1 Tax=Haloarcula saliterrae TaxID=2950534 RepID=A0ABU2F9F8_9EURY|nr:hypothetical protein [Haloarcula sp. S1CR25-12]MDS0258543.1 hypothetical protein [Haloarcula sp. S1CR25-12]